MHCSTVEVLRHIMSRACSPSVRSLGAEDYQARPVTVRHALPKQPTQGAWVGSRGYMCDHVPQL